MKLKTLSSIAAFGALLLLATQVYSAPKKGDTVKVRVLRAKIMKKPKFMGAVAGSVSRGQQLKIVAAKGGWYQVEGDFNGWVHKTSVTKGKVIKLSTKAGGGTGGTSQDEVELAGRGFSPEVEKKYRGKNPNLDFDHVDAIENAEVDPKQLEKFVTEGALLAEGGN